MNADRAETRSSHLDLEDLIAEVTGQAIGARAREHLASCEHCRTEATRWNLVADGVRGLAAAAPQEAQPARRRHAGLDVLEGRWRRTVLAAGAAAALILGGAVYLSSAALVGHAPRTVLTAVSGCSALKLASGTLEHVNGTSLVLQTASGQPVTVATTASTHLSESGPLRNDITDGASVIVLGRSSGGTIAAVAVTIGNPAGLNRPSALGSVVVTGTVSGASAAGFTVITPGGTRVPVTTFSDTIVTLLNISLGQLPAGATTYAIGFTGPDGTLTARAVTAIRQLPQGGPQLNVHVRNCSPASIDNALAFGG
jgi:hypothetical protein